MKKILMSLNIIAIVLIIYNSLIIQKVHAEGEYTRDLSKIDINVTVNNTTIKGFIANPVSYYEESASGFLNAQEIKYLSVGDNENVIYTCEYPTTTSKRSGNYVEIACEMENNKYIVKEINTNGNGDTYIPVGGFVLSLPKDKYASSFKINDEIVLGGTKLTIPTKAVESDKGARIIINNTNTTRSAPMVVYYDYQFGEKTGTNIYGTEMTCTYDFDKNTFEVKSFRGFGTGDDSGITIPDNSFVLSAYGEGYRGLLVKNELFNIGDEVKMVGFDFIRFGGTVVGEYQYINPTKEENPKGMETATTPFPAYRGENQTIIYKSGWSYNGASGTGTNIYGYEAAVDKNGVVVELNVNVSSIPEGGYVISGHGKGRDFIRSNIVLGASIELNEDTKTYKISTTLNSYYENLVLDVKNAINDANTKIKQLYDINDEELNTYIKVLEEKLNDLEKVKNEIETLLEDNNWSEKERLNKLMVYNSYQLEIEKYTHLLIATSSESKAVASKAVWHRPIEMNYDEIDSTLKLYHEIGINLVFVESFYNGYSMFKSKYEELFPYNPKFVGPYKNGDTMYDDYLSCFVAVAAKYDIEVHAWVENFYVGTLNDVAVLKKHPEWILYNNDDTYIQKNEGGLYIFLDPANKDVQDSLINYYLDMFEKIPTIAGLNLDYIRYPVSDETEDVGYTIAAMEKFGNLKGLTFTSAQKNDRSKMAKKFKQLFDENYLFGGKEEAQKNYEEWVSYRTNIISDYVKRIKTEVKDVKKIKLSTSVFASLSDSINNKKQDWKSWIEKGWIDIATPMAYYTDATDVLSNVNQMILSAGNNSYYYAGLASSYSGLPAYRNTEQIVSAFKAGSYGYVIFCSTQIIGHEDVQNVLKAGVNSTSSVLPHADVDKVLKASFDDIISKCERLYIKANLMSEEQKQSLIKQFNEILQMPTSTTVEIYKVQQRILSLYSKGVSKYAKGYAGQRLTENLKYLYKVLETKISRSLIDSKEWDPEKYPQHPIVNEDGITMVENKDDNKNNNDNNNNNNVNPKTSSYWWEYVLGAGLVAGLGATIIVLMRKKRMNNK